ncbi:MAG: hypothetical protein DWQ51_10265 [Microcystis wesenbergii TW10]|uniref:Uncharacterized protein n=2 Tax=Microcystis TaxID=1125 RepID=A0A552AAU3_MICAE|nr:MAG: hypothetical protein DWQ51_10265 [Microcystis wesenbergii TW10]TRT82599.1 MAG: hypothetical protein EWV63_19150 [Microcystis aeruginosa Ma_OC_H_19870700_S124]
MPFFTAEGSLLTIKYLSKINYTYLTTSCLLHECLLPLLTKKLILHHYLKYHSRQTKGTDFGNFNLNQFAAQFLNISRQES